MRRIVVVGIVLLAAVFALGSVAFAGTYTFQSRDSGGTRSDFEDLDHTKAYLWAFKWAPVSGEVITGATLSFSGIYNHDDLKNWLGVYLIKDKASAGTGWSAWTTDGFGTQDLTPSTAVYQKGDAENVASPFSSIADKVLVGAYSDTRRGSSVTDNLVFDFAHPLLKSASNPTWGWSVYDDIPLQASTIDELNAWTGNSDWALGVDPDCHFYNCGVTLTITTAKTPTNNNVPEPISMVLGALGLGTIGGIRRLRRK